MSVSAREYAILYVAGKRTASAGIVGGNAILGGPGGGVDISTRTPLVDSGAGAAGSGTNASADDHVHPAGGGGGSVASAKMYQGSEAIIAAFADAPLAVGDHVDWDDAGFVSGDTFVIPAGMGGKYLIEGRGDFYPSGTPSSGYADLCITKGASWPGGRIDQSRLTYYDFLANGNDDIYLKCSIVVVLADGDVIGLHVSNSLDVTVKVDDDLPTGTYLAIMKLS